MYNTRSIVHTGRPTSISSAKITHTSNEIRHQFSTFVVDREPRIVRHAGSLKSCRDREHAQQPRAASGFQSAPTPEQRTVHDPEFGDVDRSLILMGRGRTPERGPLSARWPDRRMPRGPVPVPARLADRLSIIFLIDKPVCGRLTMRRVPPCEQRTSSGGGRPVAVGPI
jgi:hypothetical protein